MVHHDIYEIHHISFFTAFIGRDMYEKGQTDYDYFSRLDYSFFTLFQLLTLDAWIDAGIFRQLIPFNGKGGNGVQVIRSLRIFRIL